MIGELYHLREEHIGRMRAVEALDREPIRSLLNSASVPSTPSMQL